MSEQIVQASIFKAQCLALLDAVASVATPIPMAEAIQRAKTAHPALAQQDWIDLARLLERDHYFKRAASGAVSFKFTVVNRWWVWHRNLPVANVAAGPAK